MFNWLHGVSILGGAEDLCGVCKFVDLKKLAPMHVNLCLVLFVLLSRMNSPNCLARESASRADSTCTRCSANGFALVGLVIVRSGASA